jgi:signal transduction histidine kinase
MRSIGTKFSVAVGLFAAVFCGILLYRAWWSAKRHVDELTATEAELALKFDLAIRKYVGDVIRPAMAARVGKDEFVVEAMSSSYVAREIFEEVRKEFPDYVIKFSSDNARNPKNAAGPEELEIIRYFRDHPGETRWVGRLEMNGSEYFAHLSPMRMEQSCLQCHGRPQDAPKSLLDRYGDRRGFHRKVGDVAGLDVIALPMAKVNAALLADAKTSLLATAVLLVLLVGSILVAFRYLVARRLAAITRYFQEAVQQAGDKAIAPIPVRGNDEIGALAASYNALAARLQELHESLEERVKQRTDALRREQETLKHLLQSSDRERQLMAYEIHDGLAQELAGAVMQLDSYSQFKDENSEEAARAFEAGVGTLRQGLAEARRLISGLRPPILDELGPVAAIAHLVKESQGQAGAPEIELNSEVAFTRLAPVLENAIYRIVQEGLANALKHSGSKKVRIELVQRGDRIEIRIEDWGSGFTWDRVTEGSYGLKGIQERARLLGGTAKIDTAPGEGTRIAVDLPIVQPELSLP